MTPPIVGAPEPTLKGASRYAAVVDLDSETTQAKVGRLVGSNKRVLELGPSTGGMARALRERGCTIVGIEIDAEAAVLAEPHCERMIVADIDHLDWDRALNDDRFDVIVAADVLEHLKDPLVALRAVRRFLKPDGYVVVSLPNIAHLSVRLALLSGRFQYGELGLLDRTHLRFFTRHSMEQLFQDADFAIGYLERQEWRLPSSEVAYEPNIIPAELLETLEQDLEARTYQFIVVAYPLPQPGMRFIQAQMLNLIRAREAADNQVRLATQETATVREQWSQEVAALRQQLAEQASDLDRLSRQVTAAPEREVQLRTMLLDTHDQLVRRDEELMKLRQELTLATATLNWMEKSHAWKLVEKYYALRRSLVGWLKR